MKNGDLYKACAVFSVVWILFTVLTCTAGEWRDKLTRKSQEAERVLERRGP